MSNTPDSTSPAAEYVFRTPKGGWRVTGTRVSLDSIPRGYWEGQSPEVIVAEFPTLSLEKVYGAIAFYLRHRDEFVQYPAEQEARWERLRQESETRNGRLPRRLRAAC